MLAHHSYSKRHSSQLGSPWRVFRSVACTRSHTITVLSVLLDVNSLFALQDIQYIIGCLFRVCCGLACAKSHTITVLSLLTEVSSLFALQATLFTPPKCL